MNLNNQARLISEVNTCLSSKVVCHNSNSLLPFVFDSVLKIIWSTEEERDAATSVDLRDIRMMEQMGGMINDTELINRFVFHRGRTKSAGGPSQIMMMMGPATASMNTNMPM